MTDMSTQTEAQRLAAVLSSTRRWNELTDDDCDKAAAELLRLDRIEHAWQMWQDKTEWVQKTSDGHELGMHRADALRQRIERLEADNAELLEALKYISEGFRILKDSDFPALAIARAAIKKHGGAA